MKDRQGVAAVLLFAAAITIACTDGGGDADRIATPSPFKSPSSQRSLGASAGVAVRENTPGAVITPAEFHRRNPMDVVGVLHNRALNAFHSEIKQHRHRSLTGLCEDAVNLVMGLSRFGGRVSNRNYAACNSNSCS